MTIDDRQGAVPIPGFPGYHIDRTGRVWSAHRKGRIPRGAWSRWLDCRDWTLRQPWRDPEGYLHHTLVRDGEGNRQRIALHILVATTFLGSRPEGLVVAHLDGDKSNNRVENLAYVTQRENIEHKRDHGTMHCGDRSHLSRLTDRQCSRMLDCLRAGFSRREDAGAFGVTVSHVAALKTGRIRKHLTNQRV
ncbi:HNH endonuclease [Mesorhizobium sp. J18]|uniref:HNH endonuclease signature motif containing protein n=1 Tax=Mesorhizobium sp. J18 TaxID=935263 RepID=UPI00119AA7F4|nr:HNH endonuclease signature motif containing protein [Mesorhizobium sp. J18]TWG91481.1 HNH endonuclease [Mesorhizobium sp. J18]